jgi:hypothetical protein
MTLFNDQELCELDAVDRLKKLKRLSAEFIIEMSSELDQVSLGTLYTAFSDALSVISPHSRLLNPSRDSSQSHKLSQLTNLKSKVSRYNVTISRHKRWGVLRRRRDPPKDRLSQGPSQIREIEM